MRGAFAGVKQLKDAWNLFGIGADNIALGNTAHVIHFAVDQDERRREVYWQVKSNITEAYKQSYN